MGRVRRHRRIMVKSEKMNHKGGRKGEMIYIHMLYISIDRYDMTWDVCFI